MDALANTFHGKKSKITETTVNEERWSMDYEVYDECFVIEKIYVVELILSDELQPERISGIINLCYVLTGKGTAKELYNALVR